MQKLRNFALHAFIDIVTSYLQKTVFFCNLLVVYSWFFFLTAFHEATEKTCSKLVAVNMMGKTPCSSC